MNDSVTARMFPIQSQRGAAPHPVSIPWSVAELAYSVYSGRYGRSQSLGELAERGGFGPGEMDLFLPGWRDQCSEIAQLKATVASLTKAAIQADPPEPVPANEELAAKYRAESRLTEDGKPEGTRESLERCASMLDTYGPDCFPANDKGQIHFARAMMESTADEIRAFLAVNDTEPGT